MSDAESMDRFWCALSMLVGLVAARPGTAADVLWFRDVSLDPAGEARALLFLGECGDPNMVQSRVSVPLDTLRSAEPGQIEMVLFRVYEGLLSSRQSKQVAAGPSAATERAHTLAGRDVRRVEEDVRKRRVEMIDQQVEDFGDDDE